MIFLFEKYLLIRNKLSYIFQNKKNIIKNINSSSSINNMNKFANKNVISPSNEEKDLLTNASIVKNIDNRYWIEISYSFNAEVTSDIDRISKEHFIIYDAGGGSRFSLMWVGGTNIFGSDKIPNDLKLIDMLLDNYLNG